MPNLLILHTGGTIGMLPGKNGLQPDPDFCHTLRQHMLAHVKTPGQIDIRSLPPIDSANLQPAHWTLMASALLELWDNYAGFVVLHGTDTLAWSASALSFMLQGTNKPVIFTGAQIPLAQHHSDAPANLRLALLAATQPQLQEVCIAFGGRLLRGNRSRKLDAQGFSAFDSPNYPRLGTLNADGNMAFHVEHFLPPSQKAFSAAALHFQPHAVALLPIYPGICARSVQALLANPELRALVMQSYGTGNVPEADKAFIASLRTAQERGILVTNTSQCLHGQLFQDTYATGSLLKALGVIPLADMSPEAACSKLHFLLASEVSMQTVREKLADSLAGEMTSLAS